MAGLRHMRNPTGAMTGSSSGAGDDATIRQEDENPLVSLPVHIETDAQPRVLQFACDWDVGIGGSIWTSGEILATHLQTHQSKYRPLFDGKCVLELGSGTGYVGLLTAACFAPSHVVLSDLGTHVACMQQNVARNASVLRPSVQVHVTELSWGCAAHEAALLASHPQVDVILGTDVAYLPELYDPLLHTLRTIANDTTLVLLGLNRADTGMAFFQRLEVQGFEYYKLADETLPSAYRGKDFGLFEIRRRR